VDVNLQGELGPVVQQGGHGRDVSLPDGQVQRRISGVVRLINVDLLALELVRQPVDDVVLENEEFELNYKSLKN
jgi:hypothetical protein